MCNFAHMKQSCKLPYKITLVLLMTLIVSAIQAQRFVNITLDGAQTVSSIAQDKQGVIWLGTENGLYSYDGYHSYRHYADHAFSNTRVNALAFKGSMLYLATGSGILAFDTQRYSYVSTPAKEHFDNESQRKLLKEQRVLDVRNEKATLGSDVYALLHTPKGLLTGSISGLRLNQRLIPLRQGEQPLVNALAYDAKRKCYWVGTEGALYCADLQLRHFSKIEELNGNSVKCLAEDNEGKLYIGTDNGLYSLSIHNVLEHYVHDSRDAASIPNNIVWACFVDKWQNVWIGTDNGLSRLATHTYYEYMPLDKLTFTGEGNCLHAILQTKNGDWWLGGTNGLIWQGCVWYKQNNQQYPLTHNRVRKIYEDHEGDLWACTDHGINLLQRSSQQMMNFIVYDKSGKYSTAWAYDILEDRQGRIWMASYMGGIFVINKQKLVTAIAHSRTSSITATASCIADAHFTDQGKNALSGIHVGQMVMDGKGMIWASTYNRLDRIDPVRMTVEHTANVGAINYLMADSHGNVWVGDNSSVKCYDVAACKGREARLADIQSHEWQIGGKVSTMCDVEGKIWVVSDDECCVLDKNGKSFRFIIPVLSPLTMAYSKSEHVVVMGGNDGVVRVRADLTEPSAAVSQKEKMQLFLTGVIVNGAQVMDGTQASAGHADEAPLYLKKLTLESDENNFTLQLSDLPFGDHPSRVYAYRLEGIDHDWHYLNQGNLDIVYNGLPYGDYQLAVHVLDGEGNIGEEVYSLDISILPPWYLSIWARLFYLALAIGAVWGGMKFYLVRERLAEEQRQKAEILEQVDARMKFFASLAERLKAAVNHRSFEEVTQLVNSSLVVDSTAMADLPNEVAQGAPTSDSTPSTEVATESENPAEEASQQKPMTLSDADQRLLREVNEAIEKHMIDSDFNVTSLQEIIGIGGKQLYRKIKAMTGMTPVEYIRGIRLRKAAMMLKEGKFSVSEVMYSVGFSNSSYFSKCFSKEYGMTPTEFMKVKS